MKTKITKRKALDIAKAKYGKTTTDQYLGGLCLSMPVKLRTKWNNHWETINDEERAYMNSYMHTSGHYYPDDGEMSMLRLLSLHMFIEDNY